MPNVEWTNKNTLQNLIDTIHARLIQKVPHYTTMPTASADLLGEVVQFVGETNVNYTNAFFYKCNSVEDETTGVISYAWEAVDVQAATGISAEEDNAIVELPDGLYTKAVQNSALPIATVDNLGVIYEYTGATTGSLINGYFYRNEAVEDETTGDIIYEWHKINVQDPTVISEEDDNAILELPDGIYVKLVQVSTMPEAVEGNANVIYQFVGETTADYTCGYFYKNVGTEDETTGETTYAWTAIATQEDAIKHWIGTRAELDLAIEAGEIENGTIILLTDDPDIDELPTENSTNLVYSGGIWTALQEKQDVIQYAELPEAGEDYVGKVFQFIGETTLVEPIYTHGYFYECVEGEDETTGDPTYTWTAISVQEDDPYHWIGTRAEFETALENDEIPEGAVVLITDDEVSDINAIIDVVAVPVSDIKDMIYRTTDSVTSETRYFAGNETEQETERLAKYDDIQIVQVETMPVASADELNKVYQYIGTTTVVAPIYKNGYFYKCVTDGEPTPTYSWENIKIQDDVESDFHVIADEFDDTVAYAVGDYCLYNDDLYICTTAHAAGVWDANDFTATNVTEELKKKTEYKEFVGTVAEFNALPLAEKLSYNMANFTDD